MALGVLSRKSENLESTYCNMALACLHAGIKFSMDEVVERHLDQRVEVYVQKGFGEAEADYMYFDLIPKKEQENALNMALLTIKFQNENYYLIAGTDQASYPHLIYDFALAYLRLKPDHVIFVYDDYFFTLKDMERLEQEGGYFENWCYTTLPWQNSEESI